MKLQVFLVLLFLCLKGSYSTISSYSSPTGGLSFLCGCVSAEQYNTSIQIKCNKEYKVIQMEPFGYLMRDSVGSSSSIDCGKLNFNTCKGLRPDVLHDQDRIEVHKKCTLKNSCDINIAGVEEGNQRLVNYPFYCHSVSAFNDISVKKNINPNNPILSFTGENHTGRKIDCDCVATSPARIRLEIYLIHLKPTSCSKVIFLSRNVQMFECSTNDNTMLPFLELYIDKEFKLEIRDMEPDKEDVLFFRLWGESLSVNCTGCTKSKVDLSTTTATKHPSTNPSTIVSTTTRRPTTGRTTTGRPTTVSTTTVRTTTGRPTTRPSIIVSTTTSLSTTVRPTTSRPATVLLTIDQTNTDTSATDQPDTDSATGRSISAGNTDHSNNDNYPAIFGGIMAAIIIIIIVGIVIFCYIRIRRKQQRTPNYLHVSRKGKLAQNNYDEVADSNSQGSSHAVDSANSKTQNDRPMNNNFDPADSTNKISSSNNQYHVLEMDNVSTPLSACIDKGAEQNGAKHATHNVVKQKAGDQKVKKDDYDHISSGTKTSQPIHDDTYNHIDATRDATANDSSSYDDYDHIGNQNGLLNGDSLDSNSKARINGPNNQYHVLEIDIYSSPLNSHEHIKSAQNNRAKHVKHNRAKHNGAKQKSGNQKVKKDDYDHISSGTKTKISQPIHDDTYYHIDTKMAPMTGDDYDHIGNQNGLLNGKLSPVHGGKKKPMKIQKESTQKDVEINFDPDESTSSKHDIDNTEDFDTYNHLQNDL